MTPIRRLTIESLRGFRTGQSIEFAMPNGSEGSGLTAVLGANNGGKSTIIEALIAVAGRQPSTFATGKRNSYNNKTIRIAAEFETGGVRRLESVRPGSSQTRWNPEELSKLDLGIVPSRRGFNPFFGRHGRINRLDYNRNLSGTSDVRPQHLDSQFTGRLFQLAEDEGPDRAKFDDMLSFVMGRDVPEWTIDQHDTGNYFLRFNLSDADHFHTSDGLGEGIVSLFSILATLCDIGPDSAVAIDEPELSLHPQYQRRLRALLSRLAANSQIVYTTHSPYFVNWADIQNGAQIIRVFSDGSRGTIVKHASKEATDALLGLLKDSHAPHVLDLHASEIFFVENGVIVTEGQEDVIFFPKIDDAIGMKMNGSFYGWGAGGADKIAKILLLMQSLGYRRVVAIFDGDKAAEASRCREKFPNYSVHVLPANDIRTKPEYHREAKPGLWTDHVGLDESKREAIVDMYNRVNEYLESGTGSES